MRESTLTLVPLLFLVACDQEPVALPLEAVQPALPSIVSNGPAEPGNSYIVRGEYGDFAFLFIDPKTELAALVTDAAPGCIDFAETTRVPFQNIFSPAEEGLQIYSEGGWLNAAVLDAPYDCDDVLATGRVHNSWTDNDVFAWLYDHNRANAFGGSISGRVGSYNVSWHFHLTWGGLDNPDFHGALVERTSIK